MFVAVGPICLYIKTTTTDTPKLTCPLDVEETLMQDYSGDEEREYYLMSICLDIVTLFPLLCVSVISALAKSLLIRYHRSDLKLDSLSS